MDGSICKHQVAVFKFFGDALPNLPPVTAAVRHEGAILALGPAGQPLAFYSAMNNSDDVLNISQDVQLTSDPCSSTAPVLSDAKPTIGAVHKVRHAIFGQFLPPSPCHTSSHIPGAPPKVRHTSRTPRFLEGLVQKTRTKAPLYTFCFNYLRRFLSGGFVRGSFVWKVLSGVVFVRSRSVRIHLLHQKVKHHFKFHVSYV